MKLLKHHLAHCIVSVLLVAGCGSSSPRSADPTQAPTPVKVPSAATTPETPPEAPLAAEAEPPVAIDLMAAEIAAYERARPIFEEQCSACHTPVPGSKKQNEGITHFSMGSYPFDGHHKAELGETIRISIGGTEKPATMPQDDPGSIEDADLEAILAWSAAFDAAAAAGLGYHGDAQDSGHEHPKAHKHHKKHEHDKKHKHGKKHMHDKKHKPKKKHKHDKKTKAHEHKHDH